MKKLRVVHVSPQGETEVFSADIPKDMQVSASTDGGDVRVELSGEDLPEKKGRRS